MNPLVEDLAPAALLDAASTAVRRRRLSEVDELELLSQWAAIHSGEAPGGLVQVGGEGTPKVQDHCLGEIALARHAGVTATQYALADVLDLQHRLPLIWTKIRAGADDVWIARRIAKLSRKLPLACVHVVDRAIARMLGREAAGRILEVAEAKVIEADLEAHNARVEEERRRRYVGLSRTDEYGLRTLIARIEAGDAAWIDATITRVADIIAPRHDDATPDELRAIAFGYLARPAELLTLLAEAAIAADGDDATANGGTEPAAESAPESADGDNDAATPADGDEVAAEGTGAANPETGYVNRALAFPADLLDHLKDIDWRALAPKAVLYVHLHQSALHGTDGVARVEGLGPETLQQLQVLLGGAKVTVKPVIDLADRIRTTAYEHPESLKERVHLITGGDYWPWATSTSRKVDYDHPTPYVHTAKSEQPEQAGHPAQTGTHNSGPLSRRLHRWKTHAGYRSRQCGDGRYIWRTPHGLAFLVDHRGTRQIPLEHANAILNAPRGVDLHPTNFTVDISRLTDTP